jgi:endonuclease/exonuclease/phosphatase family metal-dependent hydrolase
MVAVEQSTNPFLADSLPIEFGNTASQPSNESTPNKLIVASYNIRYAVGRYLISSGVLRKIGINTPRRRSDAVARNIATASEAFSLGQLLPRPDILALQEADKETARAGGQHVANELAKQLGMDWVHAPAGIPRGVPPKIRQWWLDFEEQIGLNDAGDTGVALLSRMPLEDVTRIDLPWHECPWRPRTAVAATVTTSGQHIRIFNAHIDPHPAAEGQLEQLEVMMDQAQSSDLPTIVMGDFNTLSKQKCIQTRSLLESRGYTTPFPTGTATWRGALLRFHADWIFVKGMTINRWGVARPLNVSDHWPIWAEIGVGS